MTGREFLTLARHLANGTTEAEWRSATSRAYYAAFHIARQFFQDAGFTVARADRAHIYLSRRLLNAGDPHVIKAGSDLNDLRGSRNEADYDLHRPVTQGMAALQVRLAEQIIRFLDAARQEPTRTQVTDAMKAYERDVLNEVTWHP
jgi:uncharacterized protein (UPF0332 family)